MYGNPISKIKHCFIGRDGSIFLNRVSYTTSLCAIAFLKAFMHIHTYKLMYKFVSQDKLIPTFLRFFSHIFVKQDKRCPKSPIVNISKTAHIGTSL